MKEHKLGLFDGFTKKYSVNRLMYYETFRDAGIAEQRERQIKRFRRTKKIGLFSKTNPAWEDLSQKIAGSYKEILM